VAHAGDALPATDIMQQTQDESPICIQTRTAGSNAARRQGDVARVRSPGTGIQPVGIIQ
jgi:hypothetical protein